jgi:hypothetical protein
MVHPSHLHGGGEQDLELRAPNKAFQWQEIGLKVTEPIGVKINVLRFVFQDKRANFFQNPIAHPRLQQTVIGRADKFRDNENLNFKFESQRAPDKPEDGVRPMPINGLAAEARHEAFQQSRVLFFFIDEQLQRPVIGNIIGRLSASVREEKFTFTRFPELKMRQGTGQNTLSS